MIVRGTRLPLAIPDQIAQLGRRRVGLQELGVIQDGHRNRLGALEGGLGRQLFEGAVEQLGARAFIEVVGIAVRQQPNQRHDAGQDHGQFEVAAARQ